MREQGEWSSALRRPNTCLTGIPAALTSPGALLKSPPPTGALIYVNCALVDLLGSTAELTQVAVAMEHALGPATKLQLQVRLL